MKAICLITIAICCVQRSHAYTSQGVSTSIRDLWTQSKKLLPLWERDQGPMILKPRDSSEGSPRHATAIVLLPGCMMKPQQYRLLASEIQLQMEEQDVWCIVPEVPFGMANPLTVHHVVGNAIRDLREAGYEGENLFVGHSLGAAFLLDEMEKQEWAKEVAGVIMLGSFAQRKHQSSQGGVPRLTVCGDLDGLIRASRIAENYHHSIVEQGNDDQAKLQNPIVIVEGMNHFQCYEGEPHPMKTFRDLESEIKDEDARKSVASAISSFVGIHSHHMPSGQDGVHVSEKYALLSEVTRTGRYLEPILNAMRLEGSYHMAKPGFMQREEEDCAEFNHEGSPWAAKMQQELTNELTGLHIDKVQDEFRQSWYLVPWANPPFYLPHVHAEQSPGAKPIVEMGTVSEAIYDKLDGLFDTGFSSNTAHEIRSKFNSPQSTLKAIGVDIEHQPIPNIAAQMNDKTIEWALQNAPKVVYERYMSRGTKLVTGDDIEEKSGPAWIWSYLEYKRDMENNCVMLQSHTLCTPTDHPIPYVRGKVYAKLLSPARALDWMYTDSLRRKRQTVPEVASEAVRMAIAAFV